MTSIDHTIAKKMGQPSVSSVPSTSAAIAVIILFFSRKMVCKLSNRSWFVVGCCRVGVVDVVVISSIASARGHEYLLESQQHSTLHLAVALLNSVQDGDSIDQRVHRRCRDLPSPVAVHRHNFLRLTTVCWRSHHECMS
jgi:hypothetical protein